MLTNNNYCKSGNIRGTLIFAYFAQMTREHLLGANLTTREYVFVLQNAKI